MLNISYSARTLEHPLIVDAVLIPSGYLKNETAFDVTAVEVLNYFKAKDFNIDIDSTPETFSTIELNSNLQRLGKYVVRECAIPLFISIMAAFIYDKCSSASSVDYDPVKVKINIEVCDSTNMKVKNQIEFEGTADEFQQVADNIEQLIKAND